ncbi:ribosome binding protein [Babesia ovata]|uniref:Ribosome binding protein n=1 Tax=Babesia ovata TaxID=189622 RepID=A0A2H6KHY3_9APIC|nr:ribosome binding protein [Babesia ovata]GBE62606.1 ribosome binding protein [Babesia ovata]
MVDDLRKILDKHNDKYNDFRDVFVTSVISKAGTHKVNTANVLALVKTFCEIVISVKSPDDWEELKQHCKTLEQQLGKLFNIEGFSFTGQARTVYQLNTERFAGETAEWFRNNLHEVQHNVKQIDTKFPVDNTRHLYYLQPFATENIFPYGFIFGKDRYGTLGDAWKTLSDHWDSVIDMLGRNGDGLDKLKRILDGEPCRPSAPPPKPRPRPAPAPRPPRPALPSGAYRASGGRTSGPRPFGSRSSVGSHGSGVRAGGARGMGANHRGGIHSRGGGPGAQRDRGGPGPRGAVGAPGARGTQRSSSPGHTMSTQSQPLQSQDDLQSGSQQPLPAVSSAPSSTSQPGAPGPTSSGSDVSGQQSGTSQDAARTQPPSVTSSGSGTTGGQGPGQQGGHVVSQQGNQVVSQPTSQGVDQTPSSVGPTSAGPASGGGGGPASAKPSVPATPLQPTKPPPPPPPCSSGMAHAKFGGRKLCFPNPKVRKPTSTFALSEQDLNTVWTRVQEEKSYNTDHTQKDTQGPQTRQASSISNQHLHPSIHSSQPPSHHPGVSLPAAPGPRGSQPDNYRDIDNSGPVNPAAVRLARWLQDSTLVSGHPVVDKTDDPNEEYVRVQRKKNAEQKLADVQKKIYEQQNRRNLFTGKAISNAKGIADSAVPQGSAGIGVPMGYPIKQPKSATKSPPLPQTTFGPSTASIPQGLDLTKQHIPTKPPPVITYNDIAPLTGQVNVPPTQTLPDVSGTPIKNSPTTITSVKISPDLGVLNPLVSDAKGQPISDPNIGRRMPPLPNSKAMQLSHTLTKPPMTVVIGDHDMASLANITVSNVTSAPKPFPKISPSDAMATGYPIKPPKLPKQSLPALSSTVELTGNSIPDFDSKYPWLPPSPNQKLAAPPLPAPIELEIEKRHKTEIAFDAQIEAPPTATQGFTKPPSRTTVPPMEWIEPAISMMSLPGKAADAFTVSVDEHDNVINPGAAEFLKKFDLNTTPDVYQCQNPWYVPDSSTISVTPTPSPPPASDHMPPPDTIREMLHWLVGFSQYGHIPFIADHLKDILKEFNKDASQLSDALEVTGDPTQLTASHISNTLTEACLYSANVLFRIKHKDTSKAISMPDFSLEYSKLHYSTDPARLLCHLRDYVYACYHQLAFIKSRCYRNTKDGGWQDCQYGRDVSSFNSPLQAFLTDASDSKFKTYPFDRCNICCKSRVNMGFREKDLPASQQTGNFLLTILSPTCGGEDPLLTLASYLNCLTRRTPRTTGELVSFFHNFGNSLHDVSSQLSQLGSALSTRHDDCPGWDSLKDADLQAVQGIRGSATPTANHDKDHPKTLSTLLGCDANNSHCSPHCSPITYRAYALYSSSFVHHYLSWTVYLPDRLWESLLKLHCDLEKLQCHDSNSKSLHKCDKALPLLYTHGINPPDGTLQPSLTCSDVITKLEAVISGQPIASLMTAMDTFLYGIRAPFLYTVFTLWLIATLYILHSLLYRMDVLRIRSHLLTSRASHLIDVKALLAGSRRMLSLYKDVDYFDDDLHS